MKSWVNLTHYIPLSPHYCQIIRVGVVLGLAKQFVTGAYLSKALTHVQRYIKVFHNLL